MRPGRCSEDFSLYMLRHQRLPIRDGNKNGSRQRRLFTFDALYERQLPSLPLKYKNFLVRYL